MPIASREEKGFVVQDVAKVVLAKWPFVLDCRDCPVGRALLEQVAWARTQDHPFRLPQPIQADDHWWEVVELECRHSARAVDA